MRVNNEGQSYNVAYDDGNNMEFVPPDHVHAAPDAPVLAGSRPKK